MEKLMLYLEYPFVRYALIVGVLIALCSSLLGVTLVLKRFSFIGDGLSHVAFGAMAVAGVLGVSNNTVIVLPVTVICAVLLLKTGKNTKIKGDAAIAMISVAALAFGYLLMNLFSTSSNLSGDVCSTLFGATSILTLKKGEVWLCAILSVIVVLFFILFYHRIFDVTFDETFARAAGTNVDLCNLLIAVITAVIIVLAMNLVGSLLISALIIFPALSAMRLFSSFRQVTVCSAVISVICAFSGIVISILAGTPVGSTIVAVDVAAFALCLLISLLKGRRLNKPVLLITLLMFSAIFTACGRSDSKVTSVIQAQIDKAESASIDQTAPVKTDASADISGTAPEPDPDLYANGVTDRDLYSWEENAPTIKPRKPAPGVDVDLTILSSTMVYSQVYNMVTAPEDYRGKVIRMHGPFAVYQDPVTGQYYFACIISDATACCSQGIEFLLADDPVYPDGYPELGTEITVTGVFGTYDEGEYTYCRLNDAEISDVAF